MKFEKNHYLAFELTEKSRAHLLSVFQPKFTKVICHHVTIEFNLTEEKLAAFEDRVGDSVVHAIGHAVGDGIECVAVSIGGRTDRADGSFYHVTLSLEPPHKPVESNKLQDKVELIRGFVKLEGQFKLLKK